MSVRPSRKNRARRPLSPVEERVLYYLTGGSTGSFTRILDHPEDIARVIGSTEHDVIEALLSLEKRGRIELPDSFHESIRCEEMVQITPKGAQLLLDYAAGNTEEFKAIAKEAEISEEEMLQMLEILAGKKV
mgnify:FL=1